MQIKRDIYLNRLIERRHNHRIKIVSGVRRGGKTYLLFTLFSEWLQNNGVSEEHIIKVNLEDRRNKELRDPDRLLEYIDSKIHGDEEELEVLFDIVSSTVGSLTNPKKLANTFDSMNGSDLSDVTIKRYLDIICEAFLMEKAVRYDVKGKKYIDSPYKYYFVDAGLRNARMNFRQPDLSYVMENVIFNELRVRGYNVDVGVVPVVIRDKDGKQMRKQYEIDFVCNLGSKRYYIQSAWRMESEAKVKQEENSLINVDDSFKKIIVRGEPTPIYRNEAGITTMSIFDFLLKDNSLEL